MAFRLSPKTLTLDFGDEDLNEMKVEVFGDVSIETLMNLQIDLGSGEPAQMMDACVKFGDKVLKDWDVQDNDGQDLSATGSAFVSLPMSLATAIMSTWVEQATSADPNLKSSPNGTLPLVGAQTNTETK